MIILRKCIQFSCQKYPQNWKIICVTNEICLSVCLSVPPHISGTVWPRLMKLCMRNLHIIWKISTEKNSEKSKKKISLIFLLKNFKISFALFPQIFLENKGEVFWSNFVCVIYVPYRYVFQRKKNMPISRKKIFFPGFFSELKGDRREPIGEFL